MKKQKTPPKTEHTIELQEMQLGRDDFAALLRVEYELTIAAMQGDLLDHQRALADAQHEAVKNDIIIKRGAATDKFRGAKEAQQRFVKSLEDRYHFSFQTHSYCPETGVVRRVSED